MKRNLPSELLSTLEFWLSSCWTCVRWGSNVSAFFKIGFGVRQGSVLSPFLFAIYINDIIGCYLPSQNCHIIVYADDVLLISPSVCELQKALDKCEVELKWLDMQINAKKCCCLRIGPRCAARCADILTSNGAVLPWVNELKYLGIFIVQSRKFKCSLEHAKKSCYRVINAIFGKIGRIASEEVTLELVAKKCIPVLMYGLEAIPLTKSDKQSLDFVINRLFMKLFKTGDIHTVQQCQEFFGFELPSVRLERRTAKFLSNFSLSNGQCGDVIS